MVRLEVGCLGQADGRRDRRLGSGTPPEARACAPTGALSFRWRRRMKSHGPGGHDAPTPEQPSAALPSMWTVPCGLRRSGMQLQHSSSSSMFRSAVPKGLRRPSRSGRMGMDQDSERLWVTIGGGSADAAFLGRFVAASERSRPTVLTPDRRCGPLPMARVETQDARPGWRSAVVDPRREEVTDLEREDL